MKISFDTKVLKKHNLSLEEFYLLLFHCTSSKNYLEVCNKLVEKGILQKSVFNEYEFVSYDSIKSLVESILLNSDSRVQSNKDELVDIAIAMREIYPQGKKPGTTYMWRDSVSMIVKKLQSLMVQFDYSFTKEQAVKATQSYINSFNGDYTYMQLLKYFILKKNIKTGELQSDFMSYIENEDTEVNNNWTVNLK